MKCKIVKVKDFHSEDMYLICKFNGKDRNLLKKAGWNLEQDDRTLTLVMNIRNGRGGLRYFSDPIYDINERTTLEVDHTTANLCWLVGFMNIDSIPDELNILDYPCYFKDECIYNHKVLP